MSQKLSKFSTNLWRGLFSIDWPWKEREKYPVIQAFTAPYFAWKNKTIYQVKLVKLLGTLAEFDYKFDNWEQI